MRVIGGELRSRRLKSLPGIETRPTPDRLRESLFNVLAPRIDGAVFLDAYAGTGAVGIEALSRGAARVIFLERAKAALAVIRDNLRELGLTDRAEVAGGKVLPRIAQYDADIYFLDPPYPLEREYEGALTALGARASGLVIAQHAARFTLNEAYGNLMRTRVVRQGDNSLSFYNAGSHGPEMKRERQRSAAF